MEGELEKILYAWWWNDQSSTYKSSSIQSTLLELEENMKVMLPLMHQDDGTTLAYKAEMFYQKKPELVKRVEDFQKLYCLVVEYCSQFSSLSSLSPASVQQLENCHGVEEGAIKLEMESSDSSPKSGVEDPEPKSNAKSAIDQLKSLIETANGFGPDTIDDEMSSDIFYSLKQQILGLIEENCSHLNKLTRRNEEKREANKELRSQIEKLIKENQILQEQHRKLMDENGALHMKLQKLMSLSRCTAKKQA